MINELYLRLSDLQPVDWQNRAHFFALCARQMRRILTDQARSHPSDKRGGGAFAIPLDDAPEIGSKPDRKMIAVDDAPNAHAQVDERKSKVVELRFFDGLSVEETAEVLKVSGDPGVSGGRGIPDRLTPLPIELNSYRDATPVME